MIKTVLLIALASLIQPLIAAAELSLNLSDDTELQVNVFEAQGESLLIAYPSEHGITEGLTNLAEALTARGIEVWIADPFTSWFLPEAESSLARIPVSAYAELIIEAEKTGKNLYLFSNDKGAGIALETARAWQNSSDRMLSGVVLVSPDLSSLLYGSGQTATWRLPLPFAAEFLGFFRLIPDVRIFQFPHYFIKAFALDVIVKGTP